MKWFLLYSEIWNIVYFILEFMPGCIRRFVFRKMFYEIGKDTWIDYHTYFRYPKKIKFGNHVTVNRGCCFFASMHTEDKINIEIKNHVAIGPNVCFFSAGHDPIDINLKDTYAKITVEDHCWIGGNATILQGVTIGEGGIVGGGAVVTKDVAPYTIVAGSPAKKIADRRVAT